MKKLSRFLISGFCLLVSACGFAPLYGEHDSGGSITPQMASVQVLMIADSDGQILRNNILDRMPPTDPEPRYQLKVLTNEFGIGVAIARDATVTRQELRNNVHAELFDLKTQKIVWREDMAATAGYNVLGSQYSNLIGAEDARKRNLDDLAERLVNQLALYFDRPAS